MESRAVARYIRMSPRKVRDLLPLVKGKRVEAALTALQFTRRAAAAPLRKLLSSAISNAGQLGNVDVDLLYVKRIFVDEGPVMKRWRPRARGMASRINKRTSHITVVLEEVR